MNRQPIWNGVIVFALGVMLSGCGGHGVVAQRPFHLDESSSSSTETTQESLDDAQVEELQTQIEILNIVNDTDLFIQANNNLMDALNQFQKDAKPPADELLDSSQDSYSPADILEAMDKAKEDEVSPENQEASRRAICEYVVQLYDLASTRLNAEKDSMNLCSEKYLGYLAVLDAFVQAANAYEGGTMPQKIVDGTIDADEEVWTYLRQMEEYYRSAEISLSESSS